MALVGIIVPQMILYFRPLSVPAAEKNDYITNLYRLQDDGMQQLTYQPERLSNVRKRKIRKMEKLKEK